MGIDPGRMRLLLEVSMMASTALIFGVAIVRGLGFSY